MSNLFYTQDRKLAAGQLHQRNYAVGTSASVNTPLSLYSPSCPVPVCNGNELFARPALGLDMRFGVTVVRVHQSMTRKPPIHQSHLPAAVGTSASANTPLSLRSPSCPVPVCNGNEVFARPALGLDMRSGVTAMCVQQTMPRKPPTHQRHLPAAVKYQDLEKRKRERRKARREDGRATDAK